MWRKGTKTRDRNTELDWRSLAEQVNDYAAKLKEQLNPPEPNRGPYKLVAHRVTDDGTVKSFPIESRMHPTLADVFRRTSDGRKLGYWYDVLDASGQHIATLKGDTRTFKPEPVRVCRICQEIYRGDSQLCERCERETALPAQPKPRRVRIGRNGNDTTMSKMWK